jgi:hypothetical protein
MDSSQGVIKLFLNIFYSIGFESCIAKFCRVVYNEAGLRNNGLIHEKCAQQSLLLGKEAGPAQ